MMNFAKQLNRHWKQLYNLHLAQRRTLPEGRELKVFQNDAPSLTGHSPAFMQWMTTCEVSKDGMEKRRANTAPRLQIHAGMASKYAYSLPFAFYGDAFNQKHNPDVVNTSLGVRLEAIALGTPNDGFYVKTNFVRW